MDDSSINYLHTLERLMVEHGACIRAIPKRVRSIVEVRHINDPEFSKSNIVRKEIIYLEDFKREMLVVERVPKYAGMFLVETGLRTTAGVQFSGKKYYKSLKDVMSAIEKDDKLPCPQSP